MQSEILLSFPFEEQGQLSVSGDSLLLIASDFSGPVFTDAVAQMIYIYP